MLAILVKKSCTHTCLNIAYTRVLQGMELYTPVSALQTWGLSDINNESLRVAGFKSLLLTTVMLTLQMFIFLISAGQIVGLRPWTFFGASFIHYALSTAIQYKLNPELLVQRLKRKREGSKLWDEILMRVSNLTVEIREQSGLLWRIWCALIHPISKENRCVCITGDETQCTPEYLECMA